MKLPEIAATKTVMAGLGAVIAALVVIGGVGAFTVHSSGSGTSHSAKKVAKGPIITDACSLITAKDAGAALGSDPGPAHLVLGACLYDNGQRKLIVALTHDNAQSQFDGARGAGAKPVAGVGDGAYVLDGRLRILKGSTMVMVTLVPGDPTGANTALVTLGRAAVSRV